MRTKKEAQVSFRQRERLFHVPFDNFKATQNVSNKYKEKKLTFRLPWFENVMAVQNDYIIYDRDLHTFLIERIVNRENLTL